MRLCNFQLHGQPTTDAFQTRLAVLNNLGNATKDKKFNQQVLEGAEDVLNIANLSNLDRARALSIKACSLDHSGLKEKATSPITCSGCGASSPISTEAC